MKIFQTLGTTFIFILSLLTQLHASPQQDDRGEPYLTKSFNVGNRAEINVKTSGGSITVTGGSGSEVEVKMYVRQNGTSWFGSDDDIEEKLEEYDINISQSGNTVYAQAVKQGSGWGSNGLSISFVLEVPRQSSTELNTSGGSISLRGVEGDQKVHTSGGSITFEDISGFADAHTSGGSINVSNFQGAINGRTSGGSIRARAAGGELKLHTSGGSIVLEGVQGSIDARTSGGSIKAFVLEIDDYLTLKTSGGSVNAVIPEGIGVDLDLSGNRVNTRLTNFSGEAEKDNIEGSMNGGGADVTLKTSGGSVNLEYHRIEAKY